MLDKIKYTFGGEIMNDEFFQYLRYNNLSNNTIISYTLTIKNYFSIFDEINSNNLLAYKGYLIENYKPKSVNLKIQALNKYLEYTDNNSLRLKFVKIQKKNFLENVISYPDYLFFLNQLKNSNNDMWYFIVRYLGATGARVSELIKFKVEHVKLGYVDLYTKGGKIRRIYIPKLLKIDTLKWLDTTEKESGYLFTNKSGNQISTRGLAHQLKKYASDFNMDLNKIYPHSFRHMYAKQFLEKNTDIALLADLMGHESIETTRIYLRRTSEEQQAIVDSIVTW